PPLSRPSALRPCRRPPYQSACAFASLCVLRRPPPSPPPFPYTTLFRSRQVAALECGQELLQLVRAGVAGQCGAPRPHHDDDEAGRQQPGHGTIPTTGVHAVHHSTKPENGAPCLPTMPFLSRFRMVSGGVVSGRGSARASGVVIA